LLEGTYFKVNAVSFLLQKTYFNGAPIKIGSSAKIYGAPIAGRNLLGARKGIFFMTTEREDVSP